MKLYTATAKNTIPTIEHIQDIRQYIDSSLSNQGTGGMQPKLEAAELAQQNSIKTWIINGHEDSFLLNALDEKSRFSRIKSVVNTMV